MDADLAQPAGAAWRIPFEIGDPTPWFAAATPTSPHFHFSTVTSRFVLLGFLPEPGPARDAAMAQLTAHRALFDDVKLTAFLVLRDAGSIESARNQLPGLRWFFDPQGEVSRRYAALDPDGTAHPYWILLDPMLRTYATAPMDAADGFFAGLAGLPAPDDHAGVELTAPVVVVPRVFEPELCKRLIDIYEARGGAPSGVMRDVGGRTVGVLDDFKRRRDVFIEDDEALKAEIVSRLTRRLLPEIKRVFQFEATRLERFLVACYDADEGGYFRPHRDNETIATLHRQFAVSINLNAEQFEGGDLRFPEFGRKTYRPPTGGAVVFACGMQHEATPVTKGRRYAFLPFLYDEAGKKVRDANADALDPTPAKPQFSLKPASS